MNGFKVGWGIHRLTCLPELGFRPEPARGAPVGLENPRVLVAEEPPDYVKAAFKAANWVYRVVPMEPDDDVLDNATERSNMELRQLISILGVDTTGVASRDELRSVYMLSLIHI